MKLIIAFYIGFITLISITGCKSKNKSSEQIHNEISNKKEFVNSTIIDCDNLPKNFSTYENAINLIKEAHFKITDSVNRSKSSWIRSASYYSCDNRIGYFFFETDKHQYLHINLPLKVWNEFKNASSFGTYYNNNIKHKYQLILSN